MVSFRSKYLPYCRLLALGSVLLRPVLIGRASKELAYSPAFSAPSGTNGFLGARSELQLRDSAGFTPASALEQVFTRPIQGLHQ